VRSFLKEALVSPVLTAHPTEVQRKSILDAEREIARLLAERDLPLTPRERATTPNCCARASPRCGRPACCAIPS
jgi:phosphoenolpyruvate carboxylase